MVQAKLFMLNQEIELLSVDTRYVRSFKTNGSPSAKVIGGKLSVCFETREDSDVFLRWMTRGNGDDMYQAQDLMEEGKVCFYDGGYDQPPTRTFLFSDAYLISYRESSNIMDGTPLQTTMTISPAIQDYGVLNVEDWNLSYVEPTEELPFQPKEEDTTRPQIYDTFYEDLDGKRVKELKIGTEVNLVILSKNVSGKTVNVNLSDKNNDFIHNGELLENDILEDLTISGDTHKEKLKIVAEHLASPTEETQIEETPTEEPQSEEANAPGVAPPIVPVESSEPKELEEYFLTDANGKEIDEYEVGDQIILNVKTKNRIGDKITISLEDKSHDFRYNGEVLENDKLSDYTISKDLEKIELEVIVQLP